MSAPSVISSIDKDQIDTHSLHLKKIHRYETIKKILKIAAIVFSLAAICSFSVFILNNFVGIYLLNISSEILLSSSVGFIGLSTISMFIKKIISKLQNKIPPAEIPLQKPLSEIPPVEMSEKITEFDISDEKMTTNRFIQTLDKYLSKFNPIDAKKYLGKIEKIDLEDNSKLVIKADIHGDFVSLIKHLKTLQYKGYLDENFNIKEKYKDKIVIAFLGDYMDRGDQGFKVLNLLMKLKMLNPNEIVLVKGNHENIGISRSFIHPSERHFYNNEELTNKLEKAFSTMPLSILIGTKDESNRYQYTCLSHGSIEPDIDLNAVIDTPSKKAEILIDINKKAILSDRILNLLPAHLRDKKINELQNEKNALQQYISSQSKANENSVKNLLKIENINKKIAKQILATIKVQDFLKNHSNLIEAYRKNNTTNCNWGDISNDLLGPNNSRGTGLLLTPEFIKDYFEMINSDNRKIKALRLGHKHEHLKFETGEKKGFIEILPVAGNLKCYDVIRKPIDYAQIVNIKPKVKDWQKKILKRKRDEDIAVIGNKKPFYISKNLESPIANLLRGWQIL